MLFYEVFGKYRKDEIYDDVFEINAEKKCKGMISETLI